MKPSVNDLVVPQTLSACHALIEQLTADLTISQARIADLEGQNQALAEKVRDLSHRVFGRKSERQKPAPSDAVQGRDVTPKSPACDQSVAESELESPPAATDEIDAPQVPTSVGPRRRGQQPGAPGHGRQRRPQLPGRIDFRDVPKAQQQCSACGNWYVEAGVEEAEQIDWQVRVERVVTLRQRYRRTCVCEGTPRSVTAPAPSSLIPKGLLTVPAVVTLLLMKYLWGLPLNRVIGMLAYQGCAISAGTLVGVLKRLVPLLEPIVHAIRARNRDENHLHVDESRWRVFSDTEGKTGHHWWVWVFSGILTTVFVLDPSRSGRVPRTYLQPSFRMSTYGKSRSFHPPNRQNIDAKDLGAACRISSL